MLFITGANPTQIRNLSERPHENNISSYVIMLRFKETYKRRNVTTCNLV